MRFIGCKTNLLDNIKEVIDKHAPNAKSFCDVFSGTASVARYFKQWYEVYSNDLLYFSYCLQKGTIEAPSKPKFEKLKDNLGILDPLAYFNTMSTEDMEVLPQEKRCFQNRYAPTGGRMYVTDTNALRIDFARNTVEDWKNKGLLTEVEYYYLVACIVEGIPFVSNIAGTYGAYHKTWDKRAHKVYEVYDLPVTENGKNNKCYNEDGVQLLKRISGDILYIDPPYNERQYLPNYHVLETAAKYDFPELTGVTGVRAYEDQKSDFCSKKSVVSAFEELIKNAKFQHIILSYNTDGIMTVEDIERVMKSYGIPETFEINYIPYRRFKSRSDTRTDELKEMLVYIEKKIDRVASFDEPYIKSPMNYTGGKYKILEHIVPYFPKNINNFVDLFAGGLNVGINVKANTIYANDQISYLVDLYKFFQQSNTEELIESIKRRIAEFNLSQENQDGYIALRNEYNTNGSILDLFVLTCFSFNHQIRFNSKHEFNTPFGKNRSSFNPTIETNLIRFCEALHKKNIVLSTGDFLAFDFSVLGKGDLVYCDPPYLITTGSYNDGKRGFKDWTIKEDRELLNLLDTLNDRGIYFALSNVFTHKGLTNDELIEWSKKYHVTFIDKSYANCSYHFKDRAAKTIEVLITNYECEEPKCEQMTLEMFPEQ